MPLIRECVICNEHVDYAPMCASHLKTCMGLIVKQTKLIDPKTNRPFTFMGVFATRAFAKSAVLCKYSGDVLNKKQLARKYSNSPEDARYVIVSGKPNRFVDGADARSVASMINCAIPGVSTVNVEYVVTENRDLPVIMTTRCIKKGEELLASYGDDYWL
jgi:hypothetical protein